MFNIIYKIIDKTTRNFEWKEDEEKYFSVFYSKLTNDENSKIVLYRLSNGSIEPYFNTYPLGKIKLQGRKHSMQILKSLYKWESIEGTIDDFIEKIDDVIKYMRKYCK